MNNTNRKNVNFCNLYLDISLITFLVLTGTNRYVHKPILNFHDTIYFLNPNCLPLINKYILERFSISPFLLWHCLVIKLTLETKDNWKNEFSNKNFPGQIRNLNGICSGIIPIKNDLY